MNERLQRGVWFILPAIFVITILSIISSWSQEAVVIADSPPPILPAFEGDLYEPTLTNVKLINQNPLSITGESGWNLVFSETFTTALDSNVWSAIDNDGDTNGEYYWSTGVYSSTGITDTIARAISGGADGMLITETQGYPDNVDSWLILGPFSTEGAGQATITFDYWFDAALLDYFGVAASTNGVNYSGLQQSGGLPGWQSVSYSLNDFVGEGTVYVAFIFTSDDSGNLTNRLGAYVDNVDLYLHYPLNTYLPFVNKAFTPIPTNTPTPTNTPVATSTPTPTNTPVPGDYLDEFDDPDSGWEMRRTDSDINDWEVNYLSADELELVVDKTKSYVIASPLVPAPSPPYNIEVVARFTSQSEHRHLYGILFAADWNGTECPNSEFTSCFNRFYWLRVAWDEPGSSNPRLEFMLKRVFTFEEDNDPVSVDLIGWTSLGNADPDAWHEWDILFEEDGDIAISFNDALVATTRDTNSFGQRYFGLLGETRDIGGGRVKFDYFKLDDLE